MKYAFVYLSHISTFLPHVHLILLKLTRRVSVCVSLVDAA